MDILISLLIGAAVGAVLTLAAIISNCVVKSKAAWEEQQITNCAMRSRLHLLVAENSHLRVALAAGAMTEEGKKVAAMTMAALDAVIAAEKSVRHSPPIKALPGNGSKEPDLETAVDVLSRVLAGDLQPSEAPAWVHERGNENER